MTAGQNTGFGFGSSAYDLNERISRKGPIVAKQGRTLVPAAGIVFCSQVDTSALFHTVSSLRA